MMEKNENDKYDGYKGGVIIIINTAFNSDDENILGEKEAIYWYPKATSVEETKDIYQTELQYITHVLKAYGVRPEDATNIDCLPMSDGGFQQHVHFYNEKELATLEKELAILRKLFSVKTDPHK